MFNDTINLLHLERLRNKIELLDTITRDNTLFVNLKLKKEDLKCPVCEAPTSFHDYRPKTITYSISTNYPCYIKYHTRRYKCRSCNKIFKELNPFLEKYEKISLITKLGVLEHLKTPSNTFTSASNIYHISKQSVINIFDTYVDAQRKTLPEVLSIDEFYKARSSKYKYACMLYDFKSKKVVDVLTTRHKNYLIEYFSNIPSDEKKRVKYVIIDMWESYRDTVKLCLPKALIATRSFHLIKDLNDKVSRIRIQVMNKHRLDDTSLITNDSNYYMLKKFSYFFMKDFDSITDKLITIPKLKTAWDKHTLLNHLLSIDDTLKSVYLLKERYRTFNRTARFETCDDELDDLIFEFRNHELEEMKIFGRTLTNWRDEIKHSFIRIDGKRLSNGPIEGANSQVKTIIKTAAGIHDFYRLRNRIMYALNKDIPIKNKEKDK